MTYYVLAGCLFQHKSSTLTVKKGPVLVNFMPLTNATVINTNKNTTKPLTFILLPPANEAWGKVICFTAVCLSTGGVPAPGVVPGPGGRGAWSRGVPGGDPPGRLLLRAVRILLECILVS